jgi:two-component system sensor histidine kinase BaeS
MTGEPGSGLGPLGRRLLAAFVVVALSSVIVLTVASLIGTARGLTAGEDVARQAAAVATANAAAEAYDRAGGWADADLTRASDVAAAAGASLVIRDANDANVNSGAEMAGNGMQATACRVPANRARAAGASSPQ